MPAVPAVALEIRRATAGWERSEGRRRLPARMPAVPAVALRPRYGLVGI